LAPSTVDPLDASHDILERARAGDRAAFGVFAERIAPAIVRFAAGILDGDAHAARDVAQDAFVSTWRALPSLLEPSFLRAFVYRTAYHLAISHRRRRGPRGRPFTSLAPHDENGRPIEIAAPEPQERAWRLRDGWFTAREAAPQIHAFLSTIPGRYAAPLRLFYFQGMTSRETADALSLPETTVKMRLHRGRTLLRERLLGDARPVRSARRAARRVVPRALEEALA
jgi:RNA polymerase sigma-70 factor (ECF subfamily)